VDFNENNVTDLAACKFTNRSGPLTASGNERKVYTYAGELYFTDSSLNAVKITAGGVLNNAAAGGITGSGYGSFGVEVNWNTANTEYRLKSGPGVNDYADLQTDTIRFNDGSANWAALDGPTGLSSNLTFTLPSALPGAATFLQCSPTGVISASHTVATLNLGGGDLICDDITADDCTVDFLTVTQVIQTNGAVKHGDTALSIPAAAWQTTSATKTTMANGVFNTGGLTATAWAPIMLLAGDRIKSIVVYLTKGSASAITGRLFSCTQAGTNTELSTGSTPAASGNQSLTITSLVTMVVGTFYYIAVDPQNINDGIYGAEVTYDRP
jgi:hypothetical protein